MITRFFEKQTKKRLSLKTQFKIEFLLPFTGSRKVLEKIPASFNDSVQFSLEESHFLNECNIIANTKKDINGCIYSKKLTDVVDQPFSKKKTVIRRYIKIYQYFAVLKTTSILIT